MQCTSFTISIDDPRDITSADWIEFFAYIHTLNCVLSNTNALELHEQYLAMVSDIGEGEGAQYGYSCELKIYPAAMCADFIHELME